MKKLLRYFGLLAPLSLLAAYLIVTPAQLMGERFQIYAVAPTIGAACETTEPPTFALDTGGWYTCVAAQWALPSGSAGLSGGSGATFGPDGGSNWTIGSDSITYNGSLPSRPGASSNGLMVIDANAASSTDDAAMAIVLNPDYGHDTGDTNAYRFIVQTSPCAVGNVPIWSDKTIDGFVCGDVPLPLLNNALHIGVMIGSDGSVSATGTEACTAAGYAACRFVYKDVAGVLTTAASCSTSLTDINFLALCY